MGVITRGAQRPKRPRITWGQSAAAVPLLVDGIDAHGWWSDETQWTGEVLLSGRTYLGDTYNGVRAAAFSLFGLGAGLQERIGPAVDGMAPGTAVTVNILAQWFTTTAYAPADALPFVTVSGGTPVSLVALPMVNGDYGALTPYEVTGVVNAAGQFQLSFGWTFGPGSINAGLGIYLVDLEAEGYEPSGGLLFAENLDQAKAFPKRMPGSLTAKNVDSTEQVLWHLGVDDVLTGLVRWTPIATGTDRYGTTSTGWHGTDDTDGWLAFLQWAAERRTFTFYPDRDDDAVSYECVWDGEIPRPEPEGNRHYRLPFAIRSLAGPFEGY